MFKQLYALARQLVTLMQDVQKLKAEHKEFQQDLRVLIDIVRQLKYEQQRDRENATHERGKYCCALRMLCYASRGGCRLAVPLLGVRTVSFRSSVAQKEQSSASSEGSAGPSQSPGAV